MAGFAPAGDEYPVRLGLWEMDGTRRVELSLDGLDLPASLVAALVKGIDTTRSRSVVPLARVPGRHYVLLQRLPSGRVLTAAVGPRTRLVAPGRLARLLRAPSEGPPLYELSLSPPSTPRLIEGPQAQWRRSGAEVRIDRLVDLPVASRQVLARIELQPLPLLLVRGALLVAVDVLAIVALWLLATLPLRAVRQRLAFRRLARSFQARLAVALALFFVVPAAGFTIWGLKRLETEADRTRDLLISAVLRDAALSAGGILQEPADYLAEGLSELSDRLEADLVLYSGGRLIAASAPVLEDLALVEPLLDARCFQPLARGDELELTRQASTYVAPVRMGYRVVQIGPPGGIGILATPQLSYDWARDQDQREVTFLLLLATLAGLTRRLLGAQMASRALSRPVADLAAPPPRWARDYRFRRCGRRRPSSNRSSGHSRGWRTIFGPPRPHWTAPACARQPSSPTSPPRWLRWIPRTGGAGERPGPAAARRRLGGRKRIRPRAGRDLDAAGPGRDRVSRGEESDLAAEVEVGARMYRLQLARRPGPLGGSVLAVDDLTDVTQAARVLAWGEMARQVAHEIKNPLTPIRLGVQHLIRVRRDRPDQLEQALAETTERILSEIDRLDTIARAFSRFGLPGSGAAPLETVDVAATAREVVALYRLTADGASVEVEGLQPMSVPARRDEVKEVLGNLLENARNAGARSIVIRVEPE